MLIPSTIVVLFCIYIYICVKKKESIGQKIKNNKVFMLFISLFFLEVVMRTINNFANSFYALMIQIPCLFLSLYLLIDRGRSSYNLTKKLFYIFIISLGITGYTTYLGCLKFPNISRLMATGELDPSLEQSIRYLNIGGFNTIYTLVLMLPFWINLIKSRKFSWKTKIIVIFVIIGSMMGIIQSEYTTALLFSLLSLMTLFLPVNLSLKAFVRFLFLSIVFIFLIKAILPSALEFLAENNESQSVQIRLYDLSNILSGHGADEDSDIVNRLDKLVNSFYHFSESPIFGHFKFFGGHSYVGGVLEFYGLFGLFMLSIMLYNMYRLFVSPLENRGINTALYTMCFVYLSFLILNPQAYLVVPFLLLPICGKFLIIGEISR